MSFFVLAWLLSAGIRVHLFQVSVVWKLDTKSVLFNYKWGVNRSLSSAKTMPLFFSKDNPSLMDLLLEGGFNIESCLLPTNWLLSNSFDDLVGFLGNNLTSFRGGDAIGIVWVIWAWAILKDDPSSFYLFLTEKALILVALKSLTGKETKIMLVKNRKWTSIVWRARKSQTEKQIKFKVRENLY